MLSAHSAFDYLIVGHRFNQSEVITLEYISVTATIAFITLPSVYRTKARISLSTHLPASSERLKLGGTCGDLRGDLQFRNVDRTRSCVIEDGSGRDASACVRF